MARASADRLKKLKDEIAAGIYLPDSRAVAEKMLKRWYRLHGGGAWRIADADDAGRRAPSVGAVPDEQEGE
jgi:hypothetical protein